MSNNEMGLSDSEFRSAYEHQFDWVVAYMRTGWKRRQSCRRRRDIQVDSGRWQFQNGFRLKTSVLLHLSCFLHLQERNPDSTQAVRLKIRRKHSRGGCCLDSYAFFCFTCVSKLLLTDRWWSGLRAGSALPGSGTELLREGPCLGSFLA